MDPSCVRTQKITVDDVPLSIVRFGRGTPILCLSAVGHDAYDFAPLAERLGDRYELICVEWPGHGSSGADGAPASAARYAELVDGVLWELSIRRPIVIGNSIGGAVGILCASRHEFRALVLCDSGGFIAIDAKVKRFCGLFSRFFAAGARGAWWFKPLFGLYYRIVLPTPAAKLQRRRIVASAYRIAPFLADAWRDFGKPEADIRELAQALTIPIWVAWTQGDRIIPLNLCRPAIESLSTASLDVFAGGHSAFLEQPSEFAVRFERFMANLPAREYDATLSAQVAA